MCIDRLLPLSHFEKDKAGRSNAIQVQIVTTGTPKIAAREAEQIDYEVIDYETIINEVAYLRNRWLGIMKGLDTKQWQMGHVVRLRTAGMEDIQV